MPDDLSKFQSDLDGISSRLDKVAQSADNSSARIDKLITKLKELLRQGATGGVPWEGPTEGRLEDVAIQLLKGQRAVAGRARVGGGSRVSLSKYAEQIQQVIEQYNTEIFNANYEQLKQEAQALAKTPAKLSPRAAETTKLLDDISKKAQQRVNEIAQEMATSFEANYQKLKTEAETSIRTNVALPKPPDPEKVAQEIYQGFVDKIEADYQKLKQESLERVRGIALGTVGAKGTQPDIIGGMSGAKSTPSREQVLEWARGASREMAKARGEIDKATKSVRTLDEQFSLLAKRFGGEAANKIQAEAKALKVGFDQINVSTPRQLADGFSRFHVTLQEGGQGVRSYSMYLDQLGKVLNKVEYSERRLSEQQFTRPQLASSLGGFRSSQALGLAQQLGFGIENLKNVTTQAPSGVSTLTFQLKDQDGVIRKAIINVDKYGHAISNTNRRLLTFGQSIVRNTTELLRWSIGIGLVYGTYYKFQQLVQTAIDNETKLADISVTLGNAQRDLNDIFDEAAKVAVQTGESINSVLESYVYAYRAVGGVADPIKRTAAANQLLTDSTVLTKLSTLDAAQAIDVLSGSLRQVADPATKAEDAFRGGVDLLDKWVAVSNRANVDLGTLATAFSVTAESARNSGASIEEINAIIAVLSEKIGGLGGEETGNAVRALIGGVYQNQAAQALAQYGIAATDTAGKMRPFLEISKEIYDLYKQQVISADELNKLAYVLGGGVRRGQQYVAFLSDFARLQEIVNVQVNAQGSAQAALARKIDTTQTSITNLGNAFQKLAQTLGTEGGILDVMNGVLQAATGLIDALNTISKILGNLTIPATVLALAGFAFRGEVGANRLASLQSGIGGLAQGVVGGTLGMIPSLNQRRWGISGRYEESFATRAGQAAGFWAQKNALGILAGSYPALQRAGQGNLVGAGVDFAGAVLGALATGGSPIGAIIGSAIADKFVGSVLDHQADFQNFFKQIIPTPEELTTPEGEKTLAQRQQDLTNQIFSNIGFGGQGAIRTWTGKARASIGANVGNILSNVSGFLSGIPGFAALGGYTGGAQVTPEQVALLGATQQQKQQLFELKRQQPLEITPEIATNAAIENTRKAVQSQYQSFLKELTQKTQEDLRQQLIGGGIKPTQFVDLSKTVQGLDATLTKLYTAFGDAFDKANADINGTKDVFEALTQVIVDGSQEDTQYLIQLAGEIFDISAALEKAKESGQDSFKWNDQVYTTAQLMDLLANKTNVAVDALTALSRQQRIAQTTLPTTISLDIQAPDLNQVISLAKQLEATYLQALTPDERLKYQAEQEQALALLEVYKNASDYVKQYIRQQGGPAAEFITQALDQLTQTGAIQKVTPGKGIGFQTFDITQQQFQAIQPQYEALLQNLISKGYTPDYQKMIPIFKDGIVNPLEKDWKIVQYLLGKIEENTRDIEGIYNLPSGATFFVPAQTLRLAYNAGLAAGSGGGGFAGGAGGLTSPGTETPTSRNIGVYDHITQRIARSVLKAREDIAKEQTPTYDPTKTYYQMTPGQRDLVAGYGLQAETPQTEQKSLIDRLIESLKLLPKLGLGFNPLPGLGAAGGEDLKGMLKEFGKADKPVSTNLNLNVTSSVQLVVDGRVLADIVKSYLYDDIVKWEGTSSSVNKVLVV